MRLTSSVDPTPQRLANESFEDYKVRRRAQKLRLRLLTKGPRQAPAKNEIDPATGMPKPVNTGAWWLGQHTNERKNHHRRAVAAAGGIRQYKKHARMLRQLMSGSVSQVGNIDPVAWNNLQVAA